ncbi:hypothetical protein CB0940_10524 [Cercospora beticola]|uniref:Lysine-specific metallo-endopeptidase domain-containing protein n=1 Tax=Cercospora beticola TaxID=122368 RepID=A0A2G5HUG3_CERBT|nr:hypothetical protein CB0940_10524 [Cercospora beticola]PIA96168.1 hypothetical protein CB0940_10524 [Cercospora beticola]
MVSCSTSHSPIRPNAQVSLLTLRYSTMTLLHIFICISYNILVISATPITAGSWQLHQHSELYAGSRRAEGSSASSGSQLHPLDYAPDFSKDPFPPYPPVHQLDGSNYTADNWRNTRLFGFRGCGEDEQFAIIEAWDDFYTLAQQKGLYQNTDWNSQAAREIWGHSSATPISDEIKNQIQHIYQSAQQMYDGWFWPPDYPRPGFGWQYLWIRVACSPAGDDAGICRDKPKPPQDCIGGEPPAEDEGGEMEAYTDNSDSGDWPTIIFCNQFFTYKSLEEVKTQIKQGSLNPQDLEAYQNRVRVMFHEVTHMDYFMGSPKKVPFVDDLRIDLRYKGFKKEDKNIPCYGPQYTKTLANYDRGKPGFFTQRNADSYAWFAMAKWAEQEFGSYPTQPVVTAAPLRAPKPSRGKKLQDVSDATDVTASVTGDQPEKPKFPIPSCPGVIRPETTSIDIARTGNATCSNKDVISGIPFNVFSSTDTNVYGQFCFRANLKSPVSWTVDAHGSQKLTQHALEKRTPPPNPRAYEPYSFDLEWHPESNVDGCRQTIASCLHAFAALADSPCGHQGGQQNVMTSKGEFLIPQCGKYSYTIRGKDEVSALPPKPPSSAPPAVPSVGAQQCHAAFSGHGNIDGASQAAFAEEACAKAKGRTIRSGDPESNIHHNPVEFPEYIYDVYWTEGCKSDDGNGMDAGGSGDQSCASLLTNNYKNCKSLPTWTLMATDG